jgi:N-acetyl sugar amidotransferase
MSPIKYCKLCLQSNTRPGTKLNSQNICSACEGHREKTEIINWEQREQELKKLFDQYRNSNSNYYDCIIPVSGGKDSTYQTYIVKKVYGMNPLCVTYRTPLRTELGQRNLDNLCKEFNVDLIELKVSPETERKFILKAIKELGVPGLPQHLGIFSFTLRTAVNLKIPLIVWGENAQMEYGGDPVERQNVYLDRAWLSRHGCLHEKGF